MNAFRMTPDEIQRWERDGYFVRDNVFADEENDRLRQVAEDIVAGKRRMPMAHIDRNALIRDEDGIAAEVPPGAVIWFHSHLLHKSTNNHSQRFRRSYVSHYLSAQAEWFDPEKIGKGQPIMWVRGQTFPGKVREVERDILPIRD